MSNRILPLELIDKAIGSPIWILMRGQTELTGILRGFDDYVNLVVSHFAISWPVVTPPLANAHRRCLSRPIWLPRDPLLVVTVVWCDSSMMPRNTLPTREIKALWWRRNWRRKYCWTETTSQCWFPGGQDQRIAWRQRRRDLFTWKGRSSCNNGKNRNSFVFIFR